MTTITIAHEVSDVKFNQIQQVVEDAQLHNPDFNGETFDFERGDFTSIDGDDHHHVALIIAIRTLITGY